MIFCDLLCSNMIICQKSTWIDQNSVRKHEIRPENMMIHPMWTMFVHHEKVRRFITKSPYVSNLTKLLANSSLLINLHGNSGSSHAYIQVCAFKNANDASCTNDEWCSMYGKWSIFLCSFTCHRSYDHTFRLPLPILLPQDKTLSETRNTTYFLW